jgi:hypothetical protein
MSFKSGFGDLTAASVQIVQQIESINDATVDMSNTTIQNLNKLTNLTEISTVSRITDVQEHITFEGSAKCQFRDTGIYIQSPSDAALSIISDGTLTFDADTDIILSADGGNITMDDGTTTVFDFDVDNVVLKMMDDADTGDYFSIAVGASGRTVFTTVDDDAAAANVTFNVDGIMQIGENLGSSAKFNTVQDFTGSDPYGFATDGDMGGEIIKLGSATTTLSNLYFLTDSGAWTATDANAEATAGPVLLALALGTNSGTHGMLLRGFARVASSLLASTGTAKQGDPVYISGTAGALTFTAPSANNDIVRVVGHLIIPANSNTDSIIYFNPDTTWVKVVA